MTKQGRFVEAGSVRARKGRGGSQTEAQVRKVQGEIYGRTKLARESILRGFRGAFPMAMHVAEHGLKEG